MTFIPFNKPYVPIQSYEYIKEAIGRGKISGNGFFTQRCHNFFCDQLKFKKVLLTSSCTDALEMSAILTQISPGDEVIMPSFTFPSTANAFILRGAHIVFADSESTNPNMDASQVASLITEKTKAIVPVHYAGVSCDMDTIMQIARENQLYVVEDAAQAIDSYYKGIPLGTIGHFGAFSFHETKNLSSGEGGMLAINHERYFDRSEHIWEKGTNRSSFFRNEVDKYGWVDIGSSFLPSDIIAALLYAQLEEMDTIQSKRLQIWDRYYSQLKHLEQNGYLRLPSIPDYASNNAHLFYLICSCEKQRQDLILYLKNRGISAIFHYLPLHKSPYYKDKYRGPKLPHSELYADRLLRLPLYYNLELDQVDQIVETICEFFSTKKTIYSASINER